MDRKQQIWMIKSQLVEHVKQLMVPMRSSKSEKDGSKQLCYVHPSHFLVLPANYLKILFFKGSGQSFNLRYKWSAEVVCCGVPQLSFRFHNSGVQDAEPRLAEYFGRITCSLPTSPVTLRVPTYFLAGIYFVCLSRHVSPIAVSGWSESLNFSQFSKIGDK